VRCGETACGQHYFVEISQGTYSEYLAATPIGVIDLAWLRDRGASYSAAYMRGGPGCHWCRDTAAIEGQRIAQEEEADRKARALAESAARVMEREDPTERLLFAVRRAVTIHADGAFITDASLLAKCFPDFWATARDVTAWSRPWRTGDVVAWFARRAVADGLPALRVKPSRFRSTISFWTIEGGSTWLVRSSWRDEVTIRPADLIVDTAGRVLPSTPVPFNTKSYPSRVSSSTKETTPTPELTLRGVRTMAETLRL
jgi:hypothetical protein